jgi:hypothetical protein
MQGNALLSLLLSTGHQRYASIPESGTNPSSEPPESLKYSEFGRKMLQYSVMESSTPAGGSWLLGLHTKDGTTEASSENDATSAGNSLHLATSSSVGARSLVPFLQDSLCLCVPQSCSA